MRRDEFPIIKEYTKDKIDATLDKIRAEIEELADDEWNKQVGSVSQGLEDAIEIIDKYKAESEDRDKEGR